MAPDPAAQRLARLSKLFDSYIKGYKNAKTTNDVKLFLEALCGQEDRGACIERIAASKPALESLKAGLRLDVTPPFLNGPLKDFLLYIRDPSVKVPCSGDLLKQILAAVVQPPALWCSLVDACQQGQLGAEAKRGFGWLLLELLCWTQNPPIDVDNTALEITTSKVLLATDDKETQAYGRRIQHVLEAKQSNFEVSTSGPGGRHDNDFVDFRRISIYPTDNELNCNERPFFRRADALEQFQFQTRVNVHLDNQFRLLREDFLAELRDDIAAINKGKQGRRSGHVLKNLKLIGYHCGKARGWLPFMVVVTAGKGLESLTNITSKARRAFLKDNPRFLKHQSFGCILDNKRIVSFATVFRDEDLLIEDTPNVALRIPESVSLEKVLKALNLSPNLEFVLMETPVYAFEPVLKRLQTTVELPLWEQLLATNQREIEKTDGVSSISPQSLVEKLEHSNGKSLQEILGLPKPVHLDESQWLSLLSALSRSVSLIQGPPGTGKSFVGAVAAKALNENTQEKTLVMCFTNHALDQFLEDLLDIGIPPETMVRLGAKSTARTKPLTLSEQFSKGRSRSTWDVINDLNTELEDLAGEIHESLTSYTSCYPTRKAILAHLEFSDDDSGYFKAFEVPQLDLDEHVVGEKGKAVDETYLLDRWSQGKDAGVFADYVSDEYSDVWQLEKEARKAKMEQWSDALFAEQVEGLMDQITSFDKRESTLREALGQRDADVIQRKQIIACTTTAAAKYTKQIQSAAPGIILVEEAGEILESHVLAAMTPSTRQIILIGDHQQLRPKVNNYALTVERGDGYNLNMSLFERLVLAGFPKTTLREQHRMCPEISSLVRYLAYPRLIDAPSTTQRKPIRGLQNRVVFIDHRQPEFAASQIADRRDQGASVSKRNVWEASMVLKIVKYMAQQGYGTANQVVLTPYLGQVHLLRHELARENDPVLSDLDSFDLIRAGLLTSGSAAQSKRPIRLSTIDNYQGEECDIVIVSLTRSNPNGEIGFMFSPERLNVLLSRARQGLILIGNSETFRGSRKGGEMWDNFLDILAENNLIQDGLPVKCEQHPDKQQLLKQPSHFDELCPDGGCSALCGVKLSCGIHDCPQRCHNRADHSKMKCQAIMTDQCPKGHKITWRCFALRPASCSKCDAEARRAAERQQRDLKLEQTRNEKEKAYAIKLAEIQDEIDHERRLMKERIDEEDRKNVLMQRRQDLENIKVQRERREKHVNAQKAPPSQSPSSSLRTNGASSAKKKHESAPPSVLSDHSSRVPQSAAREEWKWQKTIEGAEDAALDKLMEMIGLENVKETFLDIKSAIDTAIRQRKSMQKERFGAALLGNPGTGKTTVARLYAQFLSAIGVLPGDCFRETTGSKLANEGVQGCKKILEDIQNGGGGALFIDEAYQLTSGANYGGAAVLDFLLAEVENLTGKVVFVLAGYNKQMESFFAHNPGIPSRFPRSIQFADYDDHELLEILNYAIDKQYPNGMALEDGRQGLYARIVSRRLGRGRGKEGFGNARAVENTLSMIASRQAKRLRKSRRDGLKPDDLLFTKEDLIGSEPAGVLENSDSWRRLQALTGLASVKESVKALFSSIKLNYNREIAEEPLVNFTLNKVFLGSPGTGKTTVAVLYGQILADIGLLSNGEVVVKNPADFVGSVLGASEAQTKGILASTIGKVLVIDEAYGLHSSSSHASADPYKTAVVDTIVAEVQSVPGDDRCVLLLGYKEKMEEMMQNNNPGLARRFPIDSAFVFEDFSDEELATIFDTKLKQQGFKSTDKARSVALDMLSRARNRPNFGNAGEIDILLNKAKFRQQKRISNDPKQAAGMFELQDFDPDFERSERAATNVAKLFEGVIGCEKIVKQLQGYQAIVANAKVHGLDPKEQIPFNFLFRGPPGTGKTSTARMMGKVYYDMGFLSTAEVIERSAKDLVGEYVGHTGPKTEKLIESALGKVLFIDEAYRLAEGQFAKEAIDELVDCVTKEKFFQKVIIILAGYEHDINRLMSVNPGLSSRFPETVEFENMTSADCFQLLIQLLRKKFDCDSIHPPSDYFRSEVLTRFDSLQMNDGFANGRDVQTLAKMIRSHILKSSNKASRSLLVSEQAVFEALDKMLSERSSRAQQATRHSMGFELKDTLPLQPVLQTQRMQSTASTSQASPQIVTSQQSQHQFPKKHEDTGNDDQDSNNDQTNHGQQNLGIRDAGVSDAVWNQLQRDKLKAEQEAQELIRLAKEEQQLKEWLAKCEDARRLRELEEIERKRRELEEKKRQEALAQEKLMKMGRCPVGFHWIRQAGGYRCAGGSHWMSDKDLSSLRS